MRPAEPLQEDALFQSQGGPVGTHGEVQGSVSSTMDVARQRLLDGAPDGYVVLTERQTAGRGRSGVWECPPGAGVLMSVILRLGVPLARQRVVVLMGAVACAEALRRLGVRASIKWPNDLVVASDGSGPLRVKKLGGLLADRVPGADGAPSYVLGIGLNVNQRRADLPNGLDARPTSMQVECGKDFDRNAVCRALFEELNRWYRRLALGQQERILARWRTLSCLLGKEIQAQVDGCLVRGTVAGIRSTGELILLDATGGRRFLSDRTTQLLL
jgi:BirA family biotin operon repressor/biotin-[acetyl-CoA-carboxylase] ligase